NVEMQHAHVPSTEPAYLKGFRERLAKTNSQVTNINLEFGPQNISAADPALRQQALDRTREWIDHAVAVGCPRIMVNQGAPTQENKDAAIATLKAMGDYGKSKNIMVAMENRGGGGARPDDGVGGQRALTDRSERRERYRSARIGAENLRRVAGEHMKPGPRRTRRLNLRVLRVLRVLRGSGRRFEVRAVGVC